MPTTSRRSRPARFLTGRRSWRGILTWRTRWRISGSADTTLKIWNAATGQEILTLKGHTGPVRSVAYSPDAKRIASGGDDMTIKVWDVTTGQELLTLKGHIGPVECVAFSPVGQRMVSSGQDKTLKVWDATPMKEQPSLAAGSFQ